MSDLIMSDLITQPGIYPGIPDEVYHADPVSGGSISSTMLRGMKNPAKLRHRLDHPPASAVFEYGTAAHKRVTGTGPEIVVVDAPDYRTKAAQAERDEARACGAVPLLPKEVATLDAMVAALERHEIAYDLLTRPGVTETTVVWDDPRGSDRLSRRCKVDVWPDAAASGPVTIVDYKTARDASLSGFTRAVVDHGYDQAAAWYTAGVTAVSGRPCKMVFVVQEKTAPYLTAVYELSPVWVSAAAAKNERMADAYMECLSNGVWPGYSEESVMLPVPSWYEMEGHVPALLSDDSDPGF